MGRLDGKRALISGTGGGIGRATALLCAREGAHVVGCDLNRETSEETVRMARAGGGHPARRGAPRGRGDGRAGTRTRRDALLERRERRGRHRPALGAVPAPAELAWRSDGGKLDADDGGTAAVHHG